MIADIEFIGLVKECKELEEWFGFKVVDVVVAKLKKN